MINCVDDLIRARPVWNNDFSDSSSEDSYDVYKGMQKIPNVPMPDFKVPPRNKKLFAVKSPSVLRVRRSALLNALNGPKQMVSSTPRNATSSNLNSSENSISQLSPINSALNGIHESHLVNSKSTDTRNTNISLKRNISNMRRSKSSDNLSRKREKHRSACIQATAEHLRNISLSLRKDTKVQNKSLQKNGQLRKSEINSKSLEPKSKDEKIDKKSILSTIESSNKELSSNSENELAGIEVLNFSSDNDVTKRTKTIELRKCSRLPVRRTVLMERQTQTTDSLEKLSKKTSKTVTSPSLKVTEKEGQSIKRKIIEPEETCSREPKKTKTVQNQIAETQCTTSLLEDKRQEQNLQDQAPQESTPNKFPSLDGAVQNNGTMESNNLSLLNAAEDALIETVLQSFDSKINSNIITISSTLESTQKSNSNNLKHMLTVSSGDKRIPEDTNVAYVADDMVSSGNTSETLQSNVIEECREEVTSSTLKSKTPEKSKPKPKSNQESFRDSRKKCTEPTRSKNNSNNNNQEIIGDSKTVEQRENLSKKRGPKGCRVKNFTIQSTNSFTENNGGPRVLQQSMENFELPNKKRRGRPKGSKTKDTSSQIMDNGRPKRHCEPVKRYLQQFFFDGRFTIKTPKTKSKKSVAGKSRKTRTKNITSVIELDCHESADTNDDVPSTSTSENTLPPKGQTAPVKSRETVELKTKNSRKNKSIIDRDNQKNNSQITENNTDSESTHAAVSKNNTILEVLANNNTNDSDNTQRRLTRTQKNNIQRRENCLVAESVGSDIVGTSKKKSRSGNTQHMQTRNRLNITQSRENSLDVENVESDGISVLCHSNNTRMQTRSRKNNSQTTENNLDSESITSGRVGSSTKKNSTIKTTYTKKKQDTSIGAIAINSDPENINFEVDSGVGGSLPKEVSVPTTSICPSVILNENISIQPSSAGSQSSKGTRKKSVTFTEPPVRIRGCAQHPAAETLFPINNTTNANTEIDSERCLIDGPTEINEDSFSGEERGNILYTVVNNEVTALDWIREPIKFNSGYPERGMKVKFALENLKTTCGIISNGYIILAPNFQKRMQVSKIYNMAYKVEQGKGMTIVQGKKKIIQVGSVFYIPLGTEYGIKNLTTEPLILFFTRISP